MSILGPLKSLTHLAGQAFAAVLHCAVHARTAETSAAPPPSPGVAADRPDATPDPGASGHPNHWPDWCAAEMEQVADILLASGSPFSLGYANDLRRAAQARWASYEASFEAAATDLTLGNDPASVHERTLRHRINEDRSK